MNEVINLIRLKRDVEGYSLFELELQAKERFSSLDLLLRCDWEEQSWSYLKSSNKLRFELIGGGMLPAEFSTMCKIFLVDVLWTQRLRSEPYSFSYISELIIPFKIWAAMGASQLSEINQDFYDETIAYLKERYTEPASLGVRLNKVIKYLNENHLLDIYIDIKNISKALGKTDEHGKALAKIEKMPLPELVSAVIHLKWAIDDSFDGSAKAINDKLCILTQVFQYGLGLRLGEVLRLPKAPLIEIDGEVFCLVWTEKGSTPMARYVPVIWRKPLSDAIKEIHRLTKFYREVATQIEQEGALGFLDERLKLFNQGKEELLAQKIDELDVLLNSKKRIAIGLWKLKKPVKVSERYELKELRNILPIASDAEDASSLVKYYKKMGFDIISESLGTRKNKHYVTGENITDVIDFYITQREEYLTLDEFLTIINPKRYGMVHRSKDKLIKDKTERLYGSQSYITFSDTGGTKEGSSINVVSRNNALEILKAYTLGGYDTNQHLPLKEIERLLPELFNQNVSSKVCSEEFCGKQQVTFYVKHSGNNEFQKVRGYLADIRKMKNYFLSEYGRMNLELERELLDASVDEYLEDGITISSKSFNIKQKPSEYLFIRAGMKGGQYFEGLPQILGYQAVTYFFKGNDRVSGAFTRYGIRVDEYIASSWQSHKGRHWQTTSLFRAGLAEIVVNKWMGRTTGQGDNYDHNTGRERAKIVGDAMLENTERFLGHIPDKVREWKKQDIPMINLPQHLNDSLKSVQYSPLGFCTRDLFLKPCEFNLRCLTGNEGRGCKHYIYDLHDPSHRERVTAERDKSSLELSRLFEVYEKGVEAAAMHIKHHMTILKNTTSILEDAQFILNESQLEELQDFMPFKKEGSFPDNCPFQCGDEK